MTGARAWWMATAVALLVLGWLAVGLVAASAYRVTTVTLLALLVTAMWTGLRCVAAVAAVAAADPGQPDAGLTARLGRTRLG